jgi:hypothetical protein
MIDNSHSGKSVKLSFNKNHTHTASYFYYINRYTCNKHCTVALTPKTINGDVKMTSYYFDLC